MSDKRAGLAEVLAKHKQIIADDQFICGTACNGSLKDMFDDLEALLSVPTPAPPSLSRYRCDHCGQDLRGEGYDGHYNIFCHKPGCEDYLTTERQRAQPASTESPAPPPGEPSPFGWNIDQVLVYVWQILSEDWNDKDFKPYPYTAFAISPGAARLRVEIAAMVNRAHAQPETPLREALERCRSWNKRCGNWSQKMEDLVDAALRETIQQQRGEGK
jgi:hypothetical protein